ncbi:hypothetical protein AOC36_02165 [Erysipelothrix larvae]|uniref:DUF2974 domain-containing protein n=1 Tax=Erysipelothrix larvae TaxID=1514105 RepID=A0A0X8GYL9_9FIRM|nr:Mbeg1-like protein [Erysipelothrix larvae]AMC92830.1 hypothetical protein AOC36_02165 [Erysipelothrix larvae]
MNVIQYIKEKDTAVDLENPVDALVLSILPYFQFELIEGFHKNMPLKIKDLVLFDFEHIPMTSYLKPHYSLLKEMMQNTQFGNVEIVEFVSETDVESVFQYASILLRVNKSALFVAFRGTMPTVVGWKEDFVLSYSEDIPSHHIASDYLNKIASTSKQPLYCGGHSKGGNVAVYAASTLRRKAHLKKVYNFDGPGFQHEIIRSKGYIQILKKVKKYVPESSVIGLLLESSETQTIIKSSQLGVLQHNPYTWKIKNGHFEVVSQLSENAQFLSKSLQDVLIDIPLEHRETALTQVFDAMKTYKLDQIDQLRELFTFDNVRKISQVYQHADDESVRLLADIIKTTLSSTAKMKVKETVNQISKRVLSNEEDTSSSKDPTP